MIEILGAPLWLTVCVGCGFLLDGLAVNLNWTQVKPYAKVGAMLLVILWTIVATGFQWDWPIRLLLAAQVFGLLGDTFLLFPNKWFVYGLGAFLLGHFCYIGLLFILLVRGLSQGWMQDLTLTLTLVGIVLWGLVVLIFWRVFAPHFRQSKASGTFWYAILFYAQTLSGLSLLTLFFVLLVPGHDFAQWFLPAGGLLFFVSDFLLAYDRFIQRIRLGQFWVHLTYHLAQFCLALGIVQYL